MFVIIRIVPLKGFICYPRNDAEDVERLQVHLTPISLEFSIEVWKDRKVDVGESWDPAIQNRIANADIFIVVITPDFFSSTYIQTGEWPNIVARARQYGALGIL